MGHIHQRRSVRGGRGFALIITLSILVLISILIVGLLAIVRIERVTSNSGFETLRAKSLANMGVDNAVALLREATTRGTASGKFWVSQPGKITVFNSNGTEDIAGSRLLFSTNLTGPAVNLNQTGFSGISPIATAASVDATDAPEMNVSWVNVLQDPTSPAASGNKLIGRYAFWVDDETSKLNLNTADGTSKYSTTSFGAGTPTEMALTVLKSDGTSISTTTAQGVSSQSGARYNSLTPYARPFNSASEVLQVTGTPAHLIADNNFNTTHYNRAPDQNIFGEPRIPLLTTTTDATNNVLSAMLGPYGVVNNNTLTGLGLPLNFLYPLANQLPAFIAPGVSKPLPQYFQAEHAGNLFSTTSIDYEMGMRIARYLKGYDSRGNNIQWPVFPGSGSGGFAAKYTDRQIDSIALQILTLMKKGTFADHFRGYVIPYVMPKGFLSGKPVRGLAQAPRVNEIVIQITTAAGSSPTFNMKIWIEWYYPKEFQGVLPANRISAWAYGNGANYANMLNGQDAPVIAAANAPVSGPSALGGYWMDNMITVRDQAGGSAGIDFAGNDPSIADPDPRSSLYHPSAAGKGTGPRPGLVWPILQMYNFSGNSVWNPGEYHSSCNFGANYFYPMKDNVTSITLGGGLAIGAHTESGTSYKGYSIDPVPLDSLRGTYTGENMSDPSVRNAILEAVIPLPNVTIPVPGTVKIHMQVADPLVNSFPGDWTVTVNPSSSDITMQQPVNNLFVSYTNGQNTIAKTDITNRADPQSIWWPPQITTAPKNRRFPSTGYLQYIRTGLMPDLADEAKPLAQQKGVPFRSLNFSPSTHSSQQTAGGASYPDWALLDLFTTPGVLQPLATPAVEPVRFTWGGATAGRLNPNVTPLPFNSISRLAPLQSMLKDLQVSTSYDTSGSPILTPLNETALALAIKQYMDGLGRPLMMPGEICNVPEVADYLYTAGKPEAISRNDLVRQIAGNLTTQSNTYTIWAVGQVIKKSINNTQYDRYESGDVIAGESKLQLLVERILDYGADGVPGNSQNPGPDGIVGTPDDPIDPVYHPSLTYPLPYQYRVIGMHEVNN